MSARPRSPRSAPPAAPVLDEDPRLGRVRGLAYLLDNSIPLPGGARIGVDALIGLIPGVGDLAGSALSVYILGQAARMGAPKPLLLRMAGNVAVETIVGSVPFLGDLFDAAWKANARNTRLLTTYLESPARAERAGRGFVVLLVVALLALLVGAAAVTVFLVRGILANL